MKNINVNHTWNHIIFLKTSKINSMKIFLKLLILNNILSPNQPNINYEEGLNSELIVVKYSSLKTGNCFMASNSSSGVSLQR